MQLFLIGLTQHVILVALPLEYPWLSLVYILLFTLAVATFVSHTVASLIMMPIISNIGLQLKMPEIVVMSTAFAGKF